MIITDVLSCAQGSLGNPEDSAGEILLSTSSHEQRKQNSLLLEIGDGFLGGYQKYISPMRLRRGTCNFHPTCSGYARQAVSKYGFLTGYMMAADRILRCHPGGERGLDLPEWHYIYPVSGEKASGVCDGKRRSTTVAGVLSVIPGIGKLYAGKTGDAAVSFCFVSFLGYLTYESFSKKAYVSGIVWAWFFGSFYAGNIYGGIDAARQFNLKYACKF